MTYRACITVQTRRDPTIDQSIRSSVERSGGVVEFITSTWETQASQELVISVLMENPRRLSPLVHSVEGTRGVAVEEVGKPRRISPRRSRDGSGPASVVHTFPERSV
jgi:hypothetical protein